MKRKKAQEEMVGFVLIILLIVVIALIFLGFSLRQKKPVQQDAEVKNLINAIMSYTTNCSIYFEPQYSNVQDLLKSCYEKRTCENLGISACQYSSDLLNAMLEKVQIKDTPVKALELNATYKPEGIDKTEEEILSIKKGICKGNSTSASGLIPLDIGNIQVSLKFCYA